MIFQRWVAVLGAVGALVAGCGDDQDSASTTGGPTPASADGKVGKSDPDVIVNDLNDAEWNDACVDLSNVLFKSRGGAHASCIVGGLLAQALGQSCMDLYDTCVKEAPDDTDCKDKPMECKASLRELDACGVSRAALLIEQTKDIDCSTSLDVLNTLKEESGEQTPECKVIEQKCPTWDDDFESEDF